MVSAKPAAAPVKHDKDFEARAERVFAVWRELRRGPVRRLTSDLYGSGRDALAPAQLDALELLVTQTEWRMSEFAAALHVDPSTATRMVDRLVRVGVARRFADRADGRGIVVGPTKAGRAQCARIMAGRRNLMKEFLDEFSDSDIDRLAELMERLTAGIARVASDRGS